MKTNKETQLMQLYTDLTRMRKELQTIEKEMEISYRDRVLPRSKDWRDKIESCLETLDDLIDNIEPTEEEQGLIPIPSGYNEA